MSTRELAAAAMGAALAVVLGYLKLYRMPQGGSITLETVPILLVCLRWGAPAGLLSGALTGVLKLLLDPFVVHPLQALLDYPLAFAALGISAVRFPRPWPGIVLGQLGRLFCHVVSGVVFFASYAPEGVPVLKYSVLYNLSTVGPETVIALLLVPHLHRRLLAVPP